MSNESFMLLSYFITLWLIGVTSMLTMRLGLAPDEPKYKKATLFFALGLGLPAIIGSPLLTLSFENPWIEAIKGTISATSYLLSAYCFKYGYSLRSNRGYSRPLTVLIHVILFSLMVLCFSTENLITNSPFIRVCFIVANIVLVTLLMAKHIKIDKKKPTSFGEKVTYMVIVFSVVTYVCYPFAMIISQSRLQYLSFSLPLQVLQLHLWIIALLVLILSDVGDIYRKQAITDTMTGLCNRGHFFKASNELLESHKVASLIYCDIDNFKEINDTFGHSVGDEVIIAFADLLKKNSIKNNVTARLGGEEFVLFLPNISIKKANEIANELRVKTETISIQTEEELIHFTVSFGVASINKNHNQHENNQYDVLDNALKEADKALYLAKVSGRNRVMSMQMSSVTI